MTVSINDLTKLGVINDITTDKMKENHTKCYEVINPHNPVDQVKFYLNHEIFQACHPEKPIRAPCEEASSCDSHPFLSESDLLN